MFVFLFIDVPATAQVPPLTPGTTQKMSQALLESFKSFEKDQQRLGIPKGKGNSIEYDLYDMKASCVFIKNVLKGGTVVGHCINCDDKVSVLSLCIYIPCQIIL